MNRIRSQRAAAGSMPGRAVTATNLPPNATGEEYLDHVRLARSEGRSPVPYQTVEQFKALCEHYPKLAHMPGPRDLELMGLPRWFGRVEEFNDLWKERFLLTAQKDAEFRAAVRFLLMGGDE